MRWEANANRKLAQNNMQQQFHQQARAREQDVNARRRRLAALLAEEEQQYNAELAADIETPLDKQVGCDGIITVLI